MRVATMEMDSIKPCSTFLEMFSQGIVLLEVFTKRLGVEEGGEVVVGLPLFFEIARPDEVHEDAADGGAQELGQGLGVSLIDVVGPQAFPEVDDPPPLLLGIRRRGGQKTGVDRADAGARLDGEGYLPEPFRQHGAEVMQNAGFIGSSSAAAGKNES
jgi:hypothetical protein